MLKHQCRSTFGNWDAEKVSPDLQKCTPPRPQFSTILPLWRSIRSNAEKHHTFRPLLEVEMSKKCTPLSGEAHFEVKMLTSKNTTTCSHQHRFLWQAWWILHQSKSKQHARVLWQLQKRWQAWVGCLKRICKDACLCIRDVRRSGRWFPERGCILEHQILGLLRWFCVAGAVRRTTLHRFTDGVEKSQTALVQGRHLRTQLSIFEEVSQKCSVWIANAQNCFVLDLPPSTFEGRLLEFVPYRQTAR